MVAYTQHEDYIYVLDRAVRCGEKEKEGGGGDRMVRLVDLFFGRECLDWCCTDVCFCK